MPKPTIPRRASASTEHPTKNLVRKRRTQAEINAFLADYAPGIQKIVRRARVLIFAVAPNVIEQIDDSANLLGYGYAATYRDTLCVLMPMKAGVNFGFPRGAEMPDPARLLQGTGKRARHVKLTDGAQINDPELRSLLELAVAMTEK